MSITTEITRLQNAKASIKTSIENKGVTVPSATKLDGYSTLIDSIQTGGGGISVDDIAQNLQPSGAITLSNSVTRIGGYAFADKPVTSVSGSAVTAIGGNAFRDTQITEINSTMFPSLTGLDMSALEEMSQLKRVYLTGAEAYLSNLYVLRNNNNSVKVARFPYCTGNTNQQAFGSCYALKVVDVGPINFISSNWAYNARALQTLILRKSAVIPLSNVTGFVGTPLRGYNSLSATVYVPQSLISSYQTASNWSTIYNEGHCTFAALEGSPYEYTDWDDSGFLE